MNKFEFELIFKLPDTQSDPESYLDALYEAGCDDALPGIGREGMITLSFIREADTAFEAISSAISNVKTAIPGAKLIEASPDYVSITDVAEILGHSRQNARKLLLQNTTPPIPVHIGNPSVWHLSEIFEWLQSQGKADRYEIQPYLVDVATITKQINTARYEVHDHRLKELIG